MSDLGLVPTTSGNVSARTPEGDVLIPGGAMWSVFAGLFLILAAAFAWGASRR